MDDVSRATLSIFFNKNLTLHSPWPFFNLQKVTLIKWKPDASIKWFKSSHSTHSSPSHVISSRMEFSPNKQIKHKSVKCTCDSAKQHIMQKRIKIDAMQWNETHRKNLFMFRCNENEINIETVGNVNGIYCKVIYLSAINSTSFFSVVVASFCIIPLVLWSFS